MEPARHAELSGFSRIFWVILGPMLLALLTMGIVSRGNGWLTLLDLAFLAVLVAVIGARWIEFHGGAAQTSTGEPATAAHLRKYAVVTIVVGLGVWIVANLLGNHWLVE
jgi:hypothetical protein